MTGCGVGLHIDEYGARIAKEVRVEYQTPDRQLKVVYIKSYGAGIYWCPIIITE